MKEDSVLSFKWQSFSSHMVVSLDTCYEKQQFVDLSLVCKDSTIVKCHKMVLANSSSFFRRLLETNEHPHPMIILHDVEADDLKTLVNFMYCGEIQVVQSEVRRLLKLAEILEVTGLRHIPSSVLIGEGSNNTTKEQCDTSKKTTTVSRVKLEEARSSSNRNTVSEHEVSAKVQNKTPVQRFIPRMLNPHKTPKVPQDITKKKEEINLNELSQRLETSNSGISIVDINDMPSTSRGLPNVPNILQKRKESTMEPVITWPHVLSTISNEKPLPLKKLRCIMDEVEIMPGNAPIPVPDNKQNEPLDRRKVKNPSEDHSMNTIFIKDEIDISSDMEEDVDMDPLEVDEIDIENLESNRTSTQQLYPQLSFHSLRKNTRTEFPPRRSSNS